MEILILILILILVLIPIRILILMARGHVEARVQVNDDRAHARLL